MRWFRYFPLWKVGLSTLLASLFGFALYIVIAMAQHNNYVMISDSFAPYAFYLDFIRGEHPISGWSLAPVTNIFPDVFLTLSIFSVVGDFGNALVLYYGLKFLLFGAGIFALCRLLGGRIDRALSFTVCGLFILTIDARYLSIVEWLAPIRHGGNMLMVLISLINFINGIKNGLTKSTYINIAALTGVGLLGDLLYLPIFLLPMLLVTALLVLKTHLSRNQGLMILLSAIIGILGFWASIKAIHLIGIVVPSKNLDSFSLDRFLYTLDTVGPVLWQEFQYSPVVFFCSFFSVGILAYLATRFVMTKNRDELRPFQSIDVFASVVLMGFCGNICAVMISSQGFHWDSGIFNFRYVQGGMILLPIFALCVIGTVRLGNTSKAAGFVLAMGVVVSALTVLHFDKERNIVRFAASMPRSYDLPYPSLAKCVDDFAVSINRKYGLSFYNNAKRLTYYSRVGLRVNSLLLSKTVANKYWYVVKQKDGRLRFPEYGFIVASLRRAREIRANFGEPSKVKSCRQGDGTRMLVMAYDRSSDYKLRSLELPAAIAIGSHLPAAAYNQDTLF